MTQGLYSAVSGIRANQTRLNVISNNVANVNTVGYKANNAHFATVFANTITGGTNPTGSLGGTNPKQIGNGVVVNDIPANFSQGGTQFTGRSTDLMINGEGFFVIERVDQNLGTINTSYSLTRAGNFSLDSMGNLVTASGNRIRGTSQLSGSAAATQGLINIPQQMIIVKDTVAATGAIVRTHFAPIGTAAGVITAARDAAADSQNIATVKLVNFSIGNDGAITATYSNGDRISVRTNVATISATDPTLARRQIIHLPSEGGTYGSTNTVATDAGFVDQIGTGVFFAGGGAASMQGMQLQLQAATVVNPGGLQYDGNNNFVIGPNSGTTTFGTPSAENRGSIQAGSLESSNVDLAGEFTNMIVTQRGLEASSRVIRTQSEVLQAIINII